jgi:Ca2+-binding RTX toxin-like protein
MTQVDLTLGNRIYRQSLQDKANSINVNGTTQDDRIEIYNGNVFGDAGNDYIARIDTTSGNVSVNYWNAQRGIRINLVEGWAEDGLGGRDTLVGITSVTGSQFNDYFLGDSNDNYYYGQGGEDTIDGGAGVDGIGIAGFKDKTGTFRPALLSELVIQVSADGRTATVTDPTGTGQYFKYVLHDVEYVWGENSNKEFARLELSSLIQPSTVALTTIAAGPAFRWNLSQALGTPTTVSFSFMTDSDAATGKRAMGNLEKLVVRDALSLISSFTGLSFFEVQESGQSYGQIRWAVNQQSKSKGYTWMPEASNLSGQAGDIFMDEESMLYLTPGGQGYEALLHELGHALGLRHPLNTDSSDKWAQVAAEKFNSTQMTVMAQTTTPESLSRKDFGALDITALRYLYGVKPVNTAPSIYKLIDSDGQSLRTIVDDGGIDAVDCSALSTGASINLEPGKMWDIGLTRDGKQATNNIATSFETVLDAIIGTSHDDVLIGNSQNNQFTPGKGNDWIDGSDGLDTVYLSGKKNDFVWNQTDSVLELWSSSASTGLKTISHVERLIFQDLAIAWDLDGNAGQVAKILGVVFGREAVKNTQYAGIGLSLMDQGFSYFQLMNLAIEAKLGIGASHAQLINLLYQNLLQIPADSGAIAYWSGQLTQGTYTQSSLAVMAADLDLNKQNINLTGLMVNGMEYVPL